MSKRRNKVIYIRTRDKIIRMCPDTGFFDSVQSKISHTDRYPYTLGNESSTFEEAFKRQFWMSGDSNTILRCFYQVLGTMMMPERQKLKVLFWGPDGPGAKYLPRIIQKISGIQHRKREIRTTTAPWVERKLVEDTDIVFRLFPEEGHENSIELFDISRNEKEMSLIQSMAIRGLSQSIKAGRIEVPVDCINALRDIRENHLDAFLRERTVSVSSDASISINDLFDDYKNVFSVQCIQPIYSKKSFIIELSKRAYRITRYKSRIDINGIMLKHCGA